VLKVRRFEVKGSDALMFVVLVKIDRVDLQKASCDSPLMEYFSFRSSLLGPWNLTGVGPK
jgi:hypothetical protein